MPQLLKPDVTALVKTHISSEHDVSRLGLRLCLKLVPAESSVCAENTDRSAGTGTCGRRHDSRESTLRRIMFCPLLLVVLNLSVAFAQAPSTSEIASKPDLVPQTGHFGPVRSIAISPDGRWLATGGEDSILRVWSVETGQVQRIFGEQGGIVQGLAFGPDSNLLAVAIRATDVGWAMRVTGIQLPAGNKLEMLEIST